jgi:hypothetical protein
MLLGTSSDNASLRKAKKLEEEKRELDNDGGASQQHANAKKRVAHFAAVEVNRDFVTLLLGRSVFI